MTTDGKFEQIVAREQGLHRSLSSKQMARHCDFRRTQCGVSKDIVHVDDGDIDVWCHVYLADGVCQSFYVSPPLGQGRQATVGVPYVGLPMANPAWCRPDAGDYPDHRLH